VFKHVLQHENRIADVAAFNSLLTGATFFASTAILVLGGLVAMLGTTERVIDVVAELPFYAAGPEPLFTHQIILMIGVFVYTFFSSRGRSASITSARSWWRRSAHQRAAGAP